MYTGALIGLGNVALNGHLPGWRKSSEFKIVAGVDPVADRCDLLVKGLPEAAHAASIADLPQDLDFVDICTPPHTHFEIAVSALERGWNVLCEKPLVLTGGQFEQIRQLATDRERVLFTVHNWKFAPICRKIAETPPRRGSWRDSSLRLACAPKRAVRHGQTQKTGGWILAKRGEAS